MYENFKNQGKQQLVGDIYEYLGWLVDAFGISNAYKPKTKISALKEIYDIYKELNRSAEFFRGYLNAVKAEEDCEDYVDFTLFL
jgi:hypothetical protein